MKFAKLAILASAPGIALAAAPAVAQDAGATIFSQVDGSEVGTVVSNDGTTVLLDTGTYEAPLPGNLLAEREGKWTINAVKSQIDGMMAQQVAQQEAAAEAQAAAAAEAAAKLDAALVVGTPVLTADAQPLGNIKELTGGNIVIANDEVGLVTLPRDFFALDANDALVARANLADIVAAVEAAGG